MRVVIVGSGGREHALSWRLSQEPGVELFLVPGNAGSQPLGTVLDAPLPVDADSIKRFTEQARSVRADLVVVGPEAPLVAGVVDALEAAGMLAFGPRASAAMLEGSKAFSKEFMARHKVPTAEYRVFDEANAALGFLDQQHREAPHQLPWVVKADGLAAGKGVVVPGDVDEAKAAVQRLMSERALGDAGARLVLEERLIGQEVSYHVVSDGKRFVALAPAQDHKRLQDQDKGPNTGGMGAYTPPPVVDAALERQIQQRIVAPTLAGMEQEGAPFRGALFVGLMVHEGAAKVLEFNVRFGDPECECLMIRLGGSLLDLLAGAARGDLSGYQPSWRAAAAMTVVLASGGYPGTVQKGLPIRGLSEANAVEDAVVFHAGTRASGKDQVQTAGGRVLAVTAAGDSVATARTRAYRAVNAISFDGMQFRRDIGHHAGL